MQRKSLLMALLVALIAIGLCTSIAVAKQSVVKTIKKEQIIDYEIVPRDTLWDISNRFYGDPWLWPKIWALNPYVNDPHWIYPENMLKIEVSGAYKTIFWEGTEAGDIPPIILFDPTFRYDIQNNRVDMITPEKLEESGEIIDEFDDKILIGEQDTVFFEMSKKENVQVGDIFTVFRTRKKIKHPTSKAKIGYLIDLVAEIKTVETHVLKSGRIVYTGKLIDSTTEVEMGDYITPMSMHKSTITLKESSLDLSGNILEDLHGNANLGDHDVVFIDLGIKHGVKPGHSFSIYRKSKKPKRLPNYHIGNLIVIKTMDNNSTCLITNSMKTVMIGDLIRSDITTELE